MNDHNLNDLIIDDIEPKNSKTKSFLTIIALGIVVLIVAIILTKIILKNPDSEKLSFEGNNTELISPELTLQSVTKTPTKESEPKAPIVIAPKKVEQAEKIVQPTVQITKEFSQEASVDIQKEKEAKLAQKLKETEAKKLANKKSLEAKDLAAKQIKKVAQAKKELQATKASNGYFIQVGSFVKTPSSQFLSVITSSGFDYKITAPSSTGTKKLLIGPYGSKAEADIALLRVKDRINKSAFILKK